MTLDPDRTRLGSSPRTVGTARHFVRRALGQRHVAPTVLNAVELLTSEIVTNALLHAEQPKDLSVRIESDHVRVEVSDASPRTPTPRQAPLGSVSGRGLGIVDALARAWGVEPVAGNGKRVWFEVDLDDRGDTGAGRSSPRGRGPR